MIAVTGTNGKTTTTSLIDSVLAGIRREDRIVRHDRLPHSTRRISAPNTTPESLDLQGFFAEIRDAGGKYAVMEASSHALVMDRLWGCHFQSAVFTNLTREHMDFHKNFEDYFAAKRRLFEGTGAGAPEAAILNADDPYSARLAGLAKQTVTYGVESSADISAKKFQLAFTGLTFTAQTPEWKIADSVATGRPNQRIQHSGGDRRGAGCGNCERNDRSGNSQQLQSVPGRFQRVDMGQPFLVIVDFAHTDDALENLIKTARELNPKGPRHYVVWLRRRERPHQASGHGRSQRAAYPISRF